MRLWMYKFFIANKLKPSLRIDPRPCVEITRLTNYAPALPKHTDCRFDLVLDLRVLVHPHEWLELRRAAVLTLRRLKYSATKMTAMTSAVTAMANCASVN
jgi:hypothetical protein